jgi:hypothetical protein
MQLANEPTPAQFPAIVAALHDDRIERYVPAAGGSMEDAFRLYLWNCSICEAFYSPLHFAEVALRNAVHTRLIDRLGMAWFNERTFKTILDAKNRSDLEDALAKERACHGVLTTGHHLVSALSLGFWLHLMTKRFDRLLWANGLRLAFPNLPNAMSREDVYQRINVIRHWRNRIAHHRAIFDQGPTRKHQETIQLIRWVSHDLADWITSGSQVGQAIALRPIAKA